MAETQYTEENIRSLDWKEHIRMRPGMYIGKLGDGSSADDGIYILLKEVIDNCIDEFVMGAGKTIEISIPGDRVIVRDYGCDVSLCFDYRRSQSAHHGNHRRTGNHPAQALHRLYRLLFPAAPGAV